MAETTSFWDSLIAGLQTITGRGKPAYSTQQKPEGAEQAYASFYPNYEITSPQYQTPNAYSLAQIGYRENELVYTCINEKAASVGEAPLMVYKDLGGADDTPEELPTHPLVALMRKPCPGLNQQEFWEITETYINIAGVAYWEKERNNRGEVIALWPMRPDWCSTYRGEGEPLRAVRYQPYGLPPLDIPIKDIVAFQYFDPLWPLLKGLSPSAVALKIVNTDTAMTDMINTFIHNGAFLGGMLKTEQALNDAEANRARTLWQQSHGGAANAGQIAVLGKGIEFKQTQNTFREMVFPEVDARSEARICMIFRVSPLLISAKVGIGVATYNNYAEARKAFYERVIQREWNWLASNIWEQLLPDFEGDSYKDYICEFDTRKVKALQEDRTAKWTRAKDAYTSRLLKLDEAREEMGLDPEGGELGQAYYEAVRLAANNPVNPEGVPEGQAAPADNAQKPAESIPSALAQKSPPDGHEFYGNQYTTGAGGSVSVNLENINLGSTRYSRTKTKDISPEMVKLYGKNKKYNQGNMADAVAHASQWSTDAKEPYGIVMTNKGITVIPAKELGSEHQSFSIVEGLKYAEYSRQFKSAPNGLYSDWDIITQGEMSEYTTATDNAEAEAKRFENFAKKRIKEGKVLDIPEYEFKYLEPERAVALVAMYTGSAIFSHIDKLLKEGAHE